MDINEMRIAEEKKQHDADIARMAEKRRLAKKVLCISITFPPSIQENLGVPGFVGEYSEMKDCIENELDNLDGKTLKCKVEFMMRTNRWIESLPEVDL